MKQKIFEAQHENLWHEIQQKLNQPKKHHSAASSEFPILYRRLCQTLALALQRGYSPALTDYLQKLVSESHQHLYGTMVERPFTLHHWMLKEFPRLVRQEWRLVLLLNIAFWGTIALIALLVMNDPQLIYSFADPNELERYKSMYSSTMFKEGRGHSGDFGMFGMYIWNNISIDFRTFGSGLFGGIPAFFLIAYNGFHGGVIGVWLCMDSATRINFLSFVVTHSSFEIIGMLLSGVAGMRLGLTLIHAGRLSRSAALQIASQRIFPMIVGAAMLTFIAAFFEAFWSANPNFSAQTKLIVGGICWTSCILFFCFAGRRSS